MSKKIVIYVLVIALIAVGFIGITRLHSGLEIKRQSYVDSQLEYLSKVRAPLLDIKLSVVQYTQLDSTELEFIDKRGSMLAEIEEANEALKEAIALEAPTENKLLLKYWKLKPAKAQDLNEYHEFIGTLTTEFSIVGEKTRPIYGIYFPSYYEHYEVDITGFYEGELQNTGIFTDVRASIEELDGEKFNTKEILHRLNEMQDLFDACLEDIGKDRILFTDLEVCEDALTVPELKELAFYTELSYLELRSSLEAMTEITNYITELDASIDELNALR